MKLNNSKKYFSIITQNIFNFPYFKGGLNIKAIPIGKTFPSFKDFRYNYDEYNNAKDLNIFNFVRFKLKISSEFHEILNKKYFNYVTDLVKILNREYNTKESKLKDLIGLDFYNKLIYQHPKYFKTPENNFDLRIKYVVINNENLKNKFYVDKIFLHLATDIDNLSVISKIENVVSQNLIIFHYGSSCRNITVRLSVWAKIDKYYIIEESENKNKEEIVNKYKIFDEEWHHMLIEFQDDLENLYYLDILKNNSFPRIMKNFLLKDKNILSENKIKIVDFDFYMNGNSTKNNGRFKNEFYYILNNH